MLLGKLEFLSTWLSAAIASSEGAGTPWRATADFGKVGEEREGPSIAKRYIYHALVNP